jgi:CHAD domain-containing protein
VIRQAGHTPNNANIHRIRIKTKRARYAAELAESTVGKSATRFIDKTRVVQDLLGLHQDAFKAHAYIQAFLKQSTSMRAAFVAGRMAERQRRRREKAKDKMKRLLNSLLKRGEKAWE